MAAFFAAGLAAAGAAPAPLPRIAAMMSAGLWGAAAAAGFASASLLDALSAPPAPLARMAAMISAGPFGAAAGFAGSAAGAESSAGAASDAGSAGASSLEPALLARAIFRISSVVSFFAIIPSHRVQNRLPAGIRQRSRNSSPDDSTGPGRLRLEMSGRLEAGLFAVLGRPKALTPAHCGMRPRRDCCPFFGSSQPAQSPHVGISWKVEGSSDSFPAPGSSEVPNSAVDSSSRSQRYRQPFTGKRLVPSSSSNSLAT